MRDCRPSEKKKVAAAVGENGYYSKLSADESVSCAHARGLGVVLVYGVVGAQWMAVLSYLSPAKGIVMAGELFSK